MPPKLSPLSNNDKEVNHENETGKPDLTVNPVCRVACGGLWNYHPNRSDRSDLYQGGGGMNTTSALVFYLVVGRNTYTFGSSKERWQFISDSHIEHGYIYTTRDGETIQQSYFKNEDV
jgi:hypothetical protein